MPRQAKPIDEAAFTQDVKEGMTGKALAEKYEMSLPTVGNWKKRLGLSKERGAKKAPKSKSPNKTVRTKVTGDWTQFDKMVKMLKEGHDLSPNVKSALRTDIIDILRSM